MARIRMFTMLAESVYRSVGTPVAVLSSSNNIFSILLRVNPYNKYIASSVIIVTQISNGSGTTYAQTSYDWR